MKNLISPLLLIFAPQCWHDVAPRSFGFPHSLQYVVDMIHCSFRQIKRQAFNIKDKAKHEREYNAACIYLTLPHTFDINRAKWGQTHAGNQVGFFYGQTDIR
jgi:hypothetical protein